MNMKITCSLLFVFALFLSVTFRVEGIASEKLTEEEKIEKLLQIMEESQVIYIRNGSEYSSKDAVSHLRFKLERAQNSWFSPKKELWTARMFIEKVASKSSISGKPYLIKLSGGEKVSSEKWLLEKLDAIEK